MYYWVLPTIWPNSKSTCCCYDGFSVNRRHQYAAAAWLLEQCRRRGDDERELWRALARYRQIGAPGLLTADRPPRHDLRAPA